MNLQGKESISITRMEGGIPLIQGQNEHALYYGLGFCHARDRGMQMLLTKILGYGKGSEHLSGDDSMLEIDIFFRKMNWYSSLGEELAKLNPEEKALLQAYCDGVNEGFAKKKPWELKLLLGYKEFSWSPEDTILLTRMTGYISLAQSQGEIEHAFLEMVQKGVSKELLRELFPYVEDYDEALFRKIKLQGQIIPDPVKQEVSANSFMASNNWAISGSRTTSGAAIFANDPHLEINRLPPVWYEVAAQVGSKYVHSASMPGLPSFIIGRSSEMSWGATYAFMDAIDSWIEECKDGKYLKDGEWHGFRVRKEVIKRKKKPDVEITIYENDHGVLAGDPYQAGYYLSTRWSGARSGSKAIRTGFQLWNVTTVEEGMKVIGEIESAFSWVMADRKGNIGYQMSGMLPKRADGISGFAPLPGWKSENDWQGFHDPADLPRAYNPEEGYIITANNDLNHLGKVDPINIPMGDYRAERIKDLIENGSKIGIEENKVMHYDTYSLQAEKFLAIIIPLLPDTPQADILKNWDLCYEVNSQGAFIFEMVYRSLYYEVFGRALGLGLEDFLRNESSIFIDFYANFDAILLKENSAWFRGRTRKEVYQRAMENGLKVPPREWGSINQITLSNILLGGKMPKFLGFDKGPFPLRGGRASVHQGQVYNSAGRATSFAPSFRLITDLSEDIVYTNFPGGVSDRRFSKLYNSDWENWVKGIYRKYQY